MTTLCLDCGDEMPARNGSRCYSCESVYQSKRNRQPKRRAYADPIYRSFVPSGLCYWGCGRPATTREHKVRLEDGGTNDPANLVSACAICNYGRGATQSPVPA